MKFELSPELKTRLSKAVSSLLRSMSGGAKHTLTARPVKRKSHKMMTGAGGVLQPQVSAYGLAKF
jgi:hypothetical protein